MNTDTGKIYNSEEQEKLAKEVREKLLPIPDDVLDRVQALNREQRKVWAREEQARTKQALKASR